MVIFDLIMPNNTLSLSLFFDYIILIINFTFFFTRVSQKVPLI